MCGEQPPVPGDSCGGDLPLPRAAPRKEGCTLSGLPSDSVGVLAVFNTPYIAYYLLINPFLFDLKIKALTPSSPDFDLNIWEENMDFFWGETFFKKLKS